ncbi:MAG: histidine kinase dimerization/phosphoacceptor domain -containing protein [bacterium]
MESFSKKNLNKEFYNYYLESSLPNMRNGLIFTSVLFTVFAAISYFLITDKPEREYYMRFGITLPFFLVSIIVMYIKPLRRHLNTIYIIINIFLCLSIFFVGISSNPSQKGYEHYFAWVMLTIIGLYIFYRLSMTSLILLGIFQLLCFFSAALIIGTYRINPGLFITNMFFVISMSSLGVFMTFLIQSLNRKNFIHQKALSENNKKLLAEIKERKRAEEDHQRIAKQYADTLDSIPDWIFVVDADKRFVMMNTALKEEHVRQGFFQDCIGKKITKVYPLISKKTLDDIDEVFTTGKILIGEQRLELIDKTLYGETRKVPIFRDNKVVQVITIMRDRSKEKEVEELKLRNAEQKEVMLREIHHRVKNNLAIVISLLNLQTQKHPNEYLQRIMKDIELRIRSMALIHEHLYHSENLDRIPLASYLHDLATIVLSTFSGKKIRMQFQLEQVDVSIETALPLGLITNELLTNAFKYAFPITQDGTIYLNLKKVEDDVCILSVKDNGVGLPENFSLQHENSLGMFIIRILVEQVDGTVEFTNDHGAGFFIRFKNHGMVRRQNLVNK